MTYNNEHNYYECQMKLKQGFYNYKYVVVDENGNLEEGGN